jgi:hypothetical protein
MKNSSENLSVAKVETGESMFTRLQAVLKKPGFLPFISFCQIFNGDDVDHLEDIAPEKSSLLKYKSVTICDIGSSFSAFCFRRDKSPSYIYKTLFTFPAIMHNLLRINSLR